MVIIFLKLFCAHLLADFLFQTERMVARKRAVLTSGQHGAMHFGIYLLVLLPFSLDVRVATVLFFCATMHGLADLIKASYTEDGWRAFVVDQFFHIIVLVAAAAFLSQTPLNLITERVLAALRGPRVWLLASGYLGVVLGGGILAQKVTASFRLPTRPGLKNAGRFIGVLERAMILTFLLVDSMEAIGLLLTAKALARYPEFKDGRQHFADYFLVGTLTSVSVAMLGGFAIRWALRSFSAQ